MRGDKSSKRKQGCLGCGGCLLVVVALLVVIPTIVLFTWSSRASRQAEAELARVREAGEPTTPDELESYYPVAPAQRDAAQRWMIAVRPLEGAAFDKAAEKLPIVGLGDDEIPPPGQPWPDLEAVEQLLKQYEGSLKQLHEAAESGQPARYPADFTLGMNMPIDWVNSLRAGVRLLTLEAHVRAHRADARGAARAIYAIFMLADSLKQEPILTSQLVRYAMEGIAQDVLQRQLPVVDFPDEELDRLQTHLRAVDYSQGVQRAMIGERVMGIMAINDPSMVGASGGATVPGWRVIRNANLSVYLKYMDRIVAASKRPLPAARRETEQIYRDLQIAKSGGSGLGNPGQYMALLLLPALSATLDAAARSTASSRATDVVIAVERFRRAHGRLPESLAELVPGFLPQVPVDPFDGRPLRYVLRGNQYIVYSVGKDAADNGGQGNEAGEPDLVFPVELREPVE